ncbi:uncharacterized protein LOC143237873 isoform X2 [Tachypleus tridentatus]|uniref:uncharacterized protein LOC143237873 isoform X2 n=1 Tax=Tachypleus tridentatus TaxID=6853 RepID=UPI003FD2700F
MEFNRKLDNGSAGVYKAIDRGTGLEVAVKKISLTEQPDKEGELLGALSPHSPHDRLTVLDWYFFPFFFTEGLQLLQVCRMTLMNPGIQLMPNVSNWV